MVPGPCGSRCAVIARALELTEGPHFVLIPLRSKGRRSDYPRITDPSVRFAAKRTADTLYRREVAGLFLKGSSIESRTNLASNPPTNAAI